MSLPMPIKMSLSGVGIWVSVPRVGSSGLKGTEFCFSVWVHGNRLQPVAKGSGAILHELLMSSMSLCTLSRQSCRAWNQQMILRSTLLKLSIRQSNFSRISFIRPSFTEELSVSVAGLSEAPSSIVIGSSLAVLSQRRGYLLLSFIITSL